MRSEASPGDRRGLRRGTHAAAVAALALLAGCGGPSYEGDEAEHQELARIAALLRRMDTDLKRQSEKIDELEKALRRGAPATTSAASPAALPEGEALTKTPGPKPRLAADEFTRKVQRALKRAGYDPGPEDGKKGALTTASIEKFQRANNLPETGMADEATWERLKRFLDDN